jgi:hypothetical protein
MAPTRYPNEIESPTGVGYNGTMEAEVYEVLEPGQLSSTQLIRVTQDWGIQIRFEMHDAGALFAHYTFDLTAFAESLGPGPEVSLGAVSVDSLSVPYDALNGQRVYGVPPAALVQIPVAAGTLPVGVYKLVVILQPRNGFGDLQPFAGIVELKPVNIFATVP